MIVSGWRSIACYDETFPSFCDGKLRFLLSPRLAIYGWNLRDFHSIKACNLWLGSAPFPFNQDLLCMAEICTIPIQSKSAIYG